MRHALALARNRTCGFGDAAVRRMRSDLVVDAEPAHRDFGYPPRAFLPTEAIFQIT